MAEDQVAGLDGAEPGSVGEADGSLGISLKLVPLDLGSERAQLRAMLSAKQEYPWSLLKKTQGDYLKR